MVETCAKYTEREYSGIGFVFVSCTLDFRRCYGTHFKETQQGYVLYTYTYIYFYEITELNHPATHKSLTLTLCIFRVVLFFRFLRLGRQTVNRCYSWICT